jgi:hypothetical protein
MTVEAINQHHLTFAQFLVTQPEHATWAVTVRDTNDLPLVIADGVSDAPLESGVEALERWLEDLKQALGEPLRFDPLPATNDFKFHFKGWLGCLRIDVWETLSKDTRYRFSVSLPVGVRRWELIQGATSELSAIETMVRYALLRHLIQNTLTLINQWREERANRAQRLN